MRGFQWLLFVSAFALTSCVVPVTQSGSNELDLTKPGAVIKNLDPGKMTLPKSLQDGSTNTAARSIAPIGRGFGRGVTQLTSLSLPSLKASGFVAFQKSINRPTTAQAFLNALKGLPEVAANTLALNAVIDTNEIHIDMGLAAPITVTNVGRLTTALSADGNKLNIYWSLRWPDGSQMPHDVNFADPVAVGAALSACPRFSISLYLGVEKSGQVECLAYHAPGDGKYLNFMASSNPTDHSSVSVEDSSLGSGASNSINVVEPQAGGGVVVYEKHASQSYNSESLGFADDNMGGIASMGFSDYDSGSGTVTPHPYLNVEYYDGTGNLVYRGWGDSAKNSSNWNWRFNEGSSTNIYAVAEGTKPTTFRVRGRWHGGLLSTEISFDGGTTYHSYVANGYNLVYHDTTNDDGSWVIQQGDALYWSDSWNSYTEQATGDWIWEQSYYKGYEVPAPDDYFGTQFFVNKTYPLKNLLPLKAGYESYVVTQHEGTTYYSWRDNSGEWQWSSSAPSNPASYDASTLHSWTNFDYWLENTAYTPKSGDPANDANTFDVDKGDVLVQLEDMQVWYWDSATGTSISKKAPGFSTYQSELPPYFGLSQSKLDAVDATKSKLTAFYAGKDRFAPATYLTGLGFTGRIAAILPQFPSLSGYNP